MITNSSISNVSISTDDGDILNPSVTFTPYAPPSVSLADAAVALRAKLAGMADVTNVVSGDDCLFIYVTNAKVWVDLPPVFPKGPDGYPTQMVVMREQYRPRTPVRYNTSAK